MSKHPACFPTLDLFQEGFQVLHGFGGWRLASGGTAEQELPTILQKHDCTDEVFVVLRGKGFMMLGESPDDLKIYPMEVDKGYVVPMGLWHAHVMEAGSQLLIVENRDTDASNSPTVEIPPAQVEAYRKRIAAEQDVKA